MSMGNGVTKQCRQPRWSVAIPVCGRTAYIHQALGSVLAQDPGQDEMQIWIVDNSSPHVAWETILTAEERARVRIHSQPHQVSAAENWSTCVKLAEGDFVHILHDDDWVLPGFYKRIEALADANPTAALLATRSFFTNERGHYTAITPLLPAFESTCRDTTVFLVECPLQCPGIVVRREAYDLQRLFSSDYQYGIDVEMWLRLISTHGGVVAPEPYACWRVHHTTITGKVGATARVLAEYERLVQEIQRAHPGVSVAPARRRIVELAEYGEKRSLAAGELEMAREFRRFWRSRARMPDRVRRLGRSGLGLFKKMCRRFGIVE